MRSAILKLLLFFVAFSLASCSPLGLKKSASGQANHIAESAIEPEECRALLGRSPASSTMGLDPQNISLLNWNIQKGKQHGWEADLGTLSFGSQLVLMQEAALHPEMINTDRLASYWSFAPGYLEDETLTGVLTLSSIEPLTHCNLTDWEPWLRTPKATSITEYALAGSEQSLVVVNIHAVNFTLGVKPYRQQLQRVAAALQDHSGPLIVSGDFNSWRQGREDMVEEFVQQLQLVAIEYREDRRIQIFGRPVDHIYVRGLQPVEVSSTSVSSSDHNPITVYLTVTEADESS